jgi:hypothetical protein
MRTGEELAKMLDDLADRKESQANRMVDRNFTTRGRTAHSVRDEVDALLAGAAALRALRVLAAFARTAPGRLPHAVQAAVDLVPWENPAAALSGGSQ